MASLLFATAGTLDYWQAWTFLAVYFAASLAITLYLMKIDPALLPRRMSGGPFAEKEPVQKIIMWLTSLGFIGLLVVPAIDRRFGWSQCPPLCASWRATLLVAARLVRAFFSCSGKTALAPRPSSDPDQRVISSGPYAWCGTRCMRPRW